MGVLGTFCRRLWRLVGVVGFRFPDFRHRVSVITFSAVVQKCCSRIIVACIT